MHQCFTLRLFGMYSGDCSSMQEEEGSANRREKKICKPKDEKKRKKEPEEEDSPQLFLHFEMQHGFTLRRKRVYFMVEFR